MTELHPDRRRFTTGRMILLLAGIAWLLAGCVTLVDTEASQEQRQDVIVSLEAGETFRQGFVSRRSGLKQVILWLRTGDETAQDGLAQIALYRTGDDPQLMTELGVPLGTLKQNEQVILSFPPLKNGYQDRFEIRLSTDSGGVGVLGRFEDVYPAGEAAIGEEFLLADSAFQLSYEYGVMAVMEDILHVFRLSWLVLPLAAVLWLPGWLLAGWLGPVWKERHRRLDLGSRLALYLGLSLAVIPVVMTWTSVMGLSWSRWSAMAAFGFLVALAVYRLWTTGVLRPGQLRHRIWLTTVTLRERLRGGPSINLALLAIFLVTLYVRVAMVRDISASPWVDSVHHAMTTRLMMETGFLPQNYLPYLEIEPSGYHPGFHSVLAAFLWLSGQDVVDGMLVFGQALNAMMVFPAYLFALLFTRRRLSGLLAALACGLFTPMPAYYTSWGRYTHLAGLAILPAALLLTQSASRRQAWVKNLPAVVLLSVTLAGLFLTHYRVAAFFGCLLLAIALVETIRWAWKRVKPTGMVFLASRPRQDLTIGLLNRHAPLTLGSAGLIALLLALPVLAPALTGLIAPKLSAWRPPTRDSFNGVTWPYINTAWGDIVLVLAGLGLAWSLVRGRLYGLALLLWTGLMFLLANLGALGLPGSGFINSISVTISLFLPLATLSGDMLAEVTQAWRRALPWRWRPVYRWGLALVAMVAIVLSSRALIGLLNPVTFLYRAADRQAIQWMAQNIPAEETVLVNPFAWGYGQYAGNDGGYWLSALGGLPTMPPPVLYGLSNSKAYIDRINTISQRVIDNGGDAAALHDLMVEESIQYVYVGARGGVISAAALRSSPLFAPRYAGQGTFVFEALK